MASEFVGAVVGERTHAIWNFIDPQDDAELDDVRLLLAAIPRFEPVRMVRIPRRAYEASVREPRDLRYLVDIVLRRERNGHGR